MCKFSENLAHPILISKIGVDVVIDAISRSVTNGTCQQFPVCVFALRLGLTDIFLKSFIEHLKLLQAAITTGVKRFIPADLGATEEQ